MSFSLSFGTIFGSKLFHWQTFTVRACFVLLQIRSSIRNESTQVTLPRFTGSLLFVLFEQLFNRTAFENLSPQSSHMNVCSSLPVLLLFDIGFSVGNNLASLAMESLLSSNRLSSSSFRLFSETSSFCGTCCWPVSLFALLEIWSYAIAISRFLFLDSSKVSSLLGSWFSFWFFRKDESCFMIIHDKSIS